MQEQMWQLDQWIKRELEVSAARKKLRRHRGPSSGAVNKRKKLSHDQNSNTTVPTSSDEEDIAVPTPCDEEDIAVLTPCDEEDIAAPRSCDEERLIPTKELGQVMAGHEVELHREGK